MVRGGGCGGEEFVRASESEKRAGESDRKRQRQRQRQRETENIAGTHRL